ncbi:hypothetical protein QBC32DRAFT_263845 [Pseudoneurospora amorphoporcata]|uniref:Uncharacterized protein n=1 Tax=Pseudoneurospora amorphoporcata TaxID=241081 RepID=A0AAN6NTK5_9PEZI|nr:hypothetical protein QBC32DRAFT_263845 [Pseudoneurospora amorphoporcata]
MARFAQSRGLDLGPALSALGPRAQEDAVRLTPRRPGPSNVLPSSQPIPTSHQRPKHQKGSTTPPPTPPHPARSPSSSMPPNGASSQRLRVFDLALDGSCPCTSVVLALMASACESCHAVLGCQGCTYR